ncbi:colicin [Ectopseudomonas oleovorans]|uniref:colicin n=1 Tax=Ectopseudomonas oleovorans TaxID=301 RepID=UPI000E6AD61E|nr:colicin [Pseudomonas oleovorans]
MNKLPDNVRLAFQRSSLGEIYSAIRCIALGYTYEKVLTIVYYLDREVEEIDRERQAELATEMLADLPADAIKDIVEKCIHTRLPIRELDPLDGFVYARMEEEE